MNVDTNLQTNIWNHMAFNTLVQKAFWNHMISDTIVLNNIMKSNNLWDNYVKRNMTSCRNKMKSYDFWHNSAKIWNHMGSDTIMQNKNEPTWIRMISDTIMQNLPFEFIWYLSQLCKQPYHIVWCLAQ